MPGSSSPIDVPPRPAWQRYAKLAGLAVAAVVLMIAAIVAPPPSEMTIETGPIGGSYYQAAQKYQTFLAKRGIILRIKANPNSLEIIQNVANPRSGVDVGFVAQQIRSVDNAEVYAVGQIEIQPLFIFASANLGRRSTLDDLRGRRIVMPPRESATSQAAIQLFQLYDITKENSQFVFIPLAEAVKALRQGKYLGSPVDAGAFMLAPENTAIRELAGDSGLHLVPINEVKAISSQLSYLRAVVLPRGIYNIADAIPPINTPLIAAPVGLIVRPGLHPYLVYTLLQAMTDTHRGPSLVSAAGDFPSIIGSELAIEPRAETYYRTGLPWLYHELAPWPASVIDRYQWWIFAALILGGVYGSARCLIVVVCLISEPFRGRKASPPASSTMDT